MPGKGQRNRQSANIAGRTSLPSFPVAPMRHLLALLFVFLALPAPAVAKTTVLASIQPLGMILAAVASPDTELKVLIPGTSSTHDYQLRPSDAEAIAAADVVVWAGPESEPYLAPLLASPREGQQVIALSKLPGVVWREQRLDPAEKKSHGPDPHLWMSTRNAALLAASVAPLLGTEKLAEQFAGELQRYRERQSLRFNRLSAATIYVAHDAYGYLFDEIGITNMSALLITPGVPASARRVTEMAQRAQKQGVRCMIGEPGFDQDGVSSRLFEGGRGRLVVIDPMFAGLAASRDSYILALIHYADTIYGCMVTR